MVSRALSNQVDTWDLDVYHRCRLHQFRKISTLVLFHASIFTCQSFYHAYIDNTRQSLAMLLTSVSIEYMFSFCCLSYNHQFVLSATGKVYIYAVFLCFCQYAVVLYTIQPPVVAILSALGQEIVLKLLLQRFCHKHNEYVSLNNYIYVEPRTC